MQIVELDIRLPYRGRGRILSRLYEKVRGRVRAVHFFPPTLEGISEIRIEVIADDASRLLRELKTVVQNGKISLRVLSEA